MPFEVREIDRTCYHERIRDLLPARIIDIHTHVWLDRFRLGDRSLPKRTQTWPARVAKEGPIEDLLETYRLMFPDKQVTPLIFASVHLDLEQANSYVSDCAAKHGLPALLFSSPDWSAEELETRVRQGGFLGIKSYLSLAPAYLADDEIRILDYFPPHQLEVLDRCRWILMLHIPRSGRLKDPVNLAQMVEIEQRWPNIKVIIAHVGRAYCNEDVGNAFEALAATESMCFDISANTNAWVFEQLIRAVGPKRILFGSDLPITRMRMRRICEGGRYINLVPRGMYGDVSADPHMRELEGQDAERLSFFMYEEIAAFGSAAEAVGLSVPDIEDVFYNNPHQLIESARPAQPKKAQLQMVWPGDLLHKPPQASPPSGYTLRTYQPGDDDGYIRVMRLAGFESWDEGAIRRTLRSALPDGLFFVVHERTNKVVATAVAGHRPSDLHPFGGELGWVGADPEHSGKGLGLAVCAAVVRRLLQAGYREIYVQTDDFRLAALKTYFKLGFVPLLFAPDMEARWERVRKELSP